ncbi:SDR family oxidoreductase [Vibrio sp. 10N.286.52.F8]|uniref:SDR family oxidoreductase n=1 Tax=Vibrio sp. 10N.286.52.F8 TaxID=3229716 RepID=UPI0035532708
MTNESTNQEQRTFVIIGGTSGIGKALAMKLRNENNTVHVASRHTGLNISNEKSICEYFESIGVFDHLIVTAGTYVKTAINAALESVTKILAKELSPIRVNAVSPGLTMTEAYKNMDDSARANMYDNAKNNLPAGKVGEPSEIAMGYLFAINNPYVTGSIIDIDGGALLG